MTRLRRKKPRKGFTLMEALLAAVILSMTVSAMVVPFVAGAQNDLAQSRQTLAVTLAQDLMEEILAKPFSDPDDGAQHPGPDAGESTRADFDNIDDYHGLVEPAGQIQPYLTGPLTDPVGATLSREATVEYIYVAGQDLSQPPSFCRVIVTVRHNGDEMACLTRLVYANE